jgi:HEAT repeat protein
VGGLVVIALDKHALFKTGRPWSQRVAVVKALRKAGTGSARRGLERLAALGDGPLRRAAAVALEEIQRG